ncbi:hypothetical protein [Rubrivivax sp. A210]|uniref:hypothetical protein n=1 Tax=Rubrivivax sp. A210 TaxID=2772301 RepID=UPI001918EB35|nr:hypothetical protein [Rubrivivax sp. A210]
MYLGQSSVLDFVVCAGLGIAAVSCTLAATITVRESAVIWNSSLADATVRVLAFVLFGGALLSIAAVLGDTKPARDSNSILGFAGGALLASPILLAAIRKKK